MTEELDLESANIVSSEEEDELSLEQVIQFMEEAWLNEKFAPEILPHKTEIVELLLGQIKYMEENLKQLPSTDLKKGIHQLELDRLKYLVTSYLRLRIEKIETYSAYILKQETDRVEKHEESYLNNKEMIFAQQYDQNMKHHFESLMRFCPNVLDAEAQIVAPNVNSMIFLKSKKDIEGIAVDDGNGDNNDLIDLTKESQILISYNSVASLVKDGDVHLI